MFLFKCYQYDTDRGIRVDSYHGLVKKKREVDFTTSIMFLFLQNNIKQMYYIYTLFFRNDYNGVDWLSVVKFKSRSLVQVVENGNNEVIGRDDVFQMDELVDPYRPPPYTKLKNPNFHVTKNTYVDINS